MFWEYLKLSGLSGKTLFSFEFIQRAGLLIGAGIVLILIGFKLKGAPGAILALLLGAVLFISLKGLL
jgi:hypothetical protein